MRDISNLLWKILLLSEDVIESRALYWLMNILRKNKNKILVFDEVLRNILFIIILINYVTQLWTLREIKNPIVWNIARTCELIKWFVIENCEIIFLENRKELLLKKKNLRRKVVYVRWALYIFVI